MSLPPLREVIARHGLTASKALGQNFLLDEQLLDRIAAIPGKLQGQSAGVKGKLAVSAIICLTGKDARILARAAFAVAL